MNEAIQEIPNMNKATQEIFRIIESKDYSDDGLKSHIQCCDREVKRVNKSSAKSPGKWGFAENDYAKRLKNWKIDFSAKEECTLKINHEDSTEAHNLLTFCVLKGNENALKVLVPELAQRVENKEEYGEVINEALWFAAAMGQTDMLSYLIQNSGDVEHTHFDWGCTPLLIAVMHEHLNAARILLLNRADPLVETKAEKPACASEYLTEENKPLTTLVHAAEYIYEGIDAFQAQDFTTMKQCIASAAINNPQFLRGFIIEMIDNALQQQRSHISADKTDYRYLLHLIQFALYPLKPVPGENRQEYDVLLKAIACLKDYRIEEDIIEDEIVDENEDDAGESSSESNRRYPPIFESEAAKLTFLYEPTVPAIVSNRIDFNYGQALHSANNDLHRAVSWKNLEPVLEKSIPWIAAKGVYGTYKLCELTYGLLAKITGPVYKFLFADLVAKHGGPLVSKLMQSTPGLNFFSVAADEIFEKSPPQSPREDSDDDEQQESVEEVVDDNEIDETKNENESKTETESKNENKSKTESNSTTLS